MSTPLRCLLLDDELPGLRYLKMLCDQIAGVEVVKTFNDPELFVQELPKLQFDVCLLDIEMPFLNGLEVANLLQGKAVIFVTAYPQYAPEAFDAEAVDYLKKPIQRDRLETALARAAKRIRSQAPSRDLVALNTDKGKTLFQTAKIHHIRTAEKDSRDKLVTFTDGAVLTLKNISFEKLLQLLPADKFCQVNKAEVVSMGAVKYFSHDEVTLVGLGGGSEVMVTLGDSYRNGFLRMVGI